MKNLFVFWILLSTTLLSAQDKKNVEYNKNGEITKAVYFYDNGAVQQEGTFNKQGELHGTWTSYDMEGNKLAVGNYVHGQKVGKWFFWADNNLKEVDYENSKIIAVSQWDQKTHLAIN